MSQELKTISRIGRARMVLVSTDTPGSPAVLSWVVAQAGENKRSRRLRFAGPGMFDQAATDHIRTGIRPLVDQITTALGLPDSDYELSAANVNAASASDLGIQIRGYSADLAIFLAMLSAATGVAVPQDVIATGHIASTAGDITAVQAMPQKIAAATADGTVHSFIYPRLDRDGSMPALSPAELAAAAQAVATAQEKLRMVAVSDIAELAQALLSEESIVLASLRQRFFAIQPPAGSDIVSRFVRFFADGNVLRFWHALERQLLQGQIAEAVELLAARMDYQVFEREYPRGFGADLLQLLRSLPPAVRRLRVKFPLIPMAKCLELANLAGETDHPDVQLLLDAANGRTGPARQDNAPGATASDAPQRATLDVVVSQINAEALADRVSRPIDAARACYTLDSVTAEDHETFMGIVAAFYLHLLRHRNPVAASAQPDAVRADALALLERAFQRSGGFHAAEAEARDAVMGGLRFVLDAMTDRFKLEEQANEVNRVLKDALDPLDWQAKVQFVAALVNQLAEHLPTDIRQRPAEQFASGYHVLARVYVQSLDQVRQVFRRL